MWWRDEPTYSDRRAAGRALARHLRRLDLEDPVILAMPRGGVPVAKEVADALGAPLDVLIVRKVGAPGQPEFGVGAIGEDGVVLLDEDVIARIGAPRELIERTVDAERAELERRLETYRGGRPAIPIADRDVVVVDDGVATGVSARAALRVVRQRGARRVVLAVPVGPPSSLEELSEDADEVVCPLRPASFHAVGAWYDDFHQVSDEEVAALLAT